VWFAAHLAASKEEVPVVRLLHLAQVERVSAASSFLPFSRDQERLQAILEQNAVLSLLIITSPYYHASYDTSRYSTIASDLT